MNPVVCEKTSLVRFLKENPQAGGVERNHPGPFLLLEPGETEDPEASVYLTQGVDFRRVCRQMVGIEGDLYIIRDLGTHWVRIGRAQLNEIVIRDALVSKFHAYLRWDPVSGLHVIIDPGSRNGTSVDGVHLETGCPRPLFGGERILIAQRVRLTFLTARILERRYRARLAG